jgi:hypothetical protein
MRNVSGKRCIENQNTHFIIQNYFFFENRAFREMIWKNIVEPGRPQITIWRMRIGCWIPKVTNTHSEYIILIDFPLQQWLRERASEFRYAYFVCIVRLLFHLPFCTKEFA